MDDKTGLPPENDEEDNVEYKRKFEADPESFRTNKLVTQAIWRMDEGDRLHGVREAVYYIGINDDGTCGGLTLNELLDSVKLFTNIVDKANAKIINSNISCVDNFYYMKIIIQSIPKKNNKTQDELMIGLMGPSGSGKTSLIGFLSYGINDDGRGNAREAVFRHDHESTDGSTSSIKYDLIGYSDGRLNNYTTGFIGSWEDIVEESTRLINITDMPGIYKYFRTALFSISSHKYDYICMTINGNCNKHELETLFFHTFVCHQLNIPIIFIITKIDLIDDKRINELFTLIKGFCQSYFDVRLINKSDDMMTKDVTPIIPLIPLSIVTKRNVDLLNALLCNLPIPILKYPKEQQSDSCMFMIYDKVFLPELGTIIIGRMMSGSIYVNKNYLIGPIGPIDNSFHEVNIKSIHKKQIVDDFLTECERGSLQLKINDKQIENSINKYMMLISPDNINKFINTFYIILNEKCALVLKDGFEYSKLSIDDIKINAKVRIFTNNVYDSINIIEKIADNIIKVEFEKNYINYIEDGQNVIINYQPRFLFGRVFRYHPYQS